jgi:Protein of unknown function (DUF2380)
MPLTIKGFVPLAALPVLGLLALQPLPAEPAAAAPVTIAVFDFELEDVTPAAAYTSAVKSSDQALAQVSGAARAELAHSGRYAIVDTSKVDAKPVVDKSLRNCEGCEAAIAQQLGAQQSMIGVVKRATQTDYYIYLLIRDAHTGKVLDEQSANFAGSEDGWPSGVRMLIKHQVLVTPN